MSKTIDINYLIKLLERDIALAQSCLDISYSSDINDAYFSGYILALKHFKKRIEKLNK